MGEIEYPLGIKYWAEHINENGKIKIRVYKCSGRFETMDAYMFETIKWPKIIMMKKWVELGTDTFRPFLIPLDHIRKNYGEGY